MASPRYQTQKHLQEKNALRDRVAKILGGTWINNKEKLINTTFLKHGWKALEDVIGWADVRCRPGWKPSYGDPFIGEDTWEEIKAAARRKDKPFYIVIALPRPDGDVWCQYHPSLDEVVTVKQGGREDRSDPNDVGNMIHVPIRCFRPVGEKCPIPYAPANAQAGLSGF